MVEARTEELLAGWREAERAFNATEIGTRERDEARRRCEEAAEAYKAFVDAVAAGGYLPASAVEDTPGA
jgi:hypothetical protein